MIQYQYTDVIITMNDKKKIAILYILWGVTNLIFTILTALSLFEKSNAPLSSMSIFTIPILSIVYAIKRDEL